MFYTFHGAVFLSLCFDRLNDKTTAPLAQNFSFLVGTSSNKESHTLLLTSSYLHILYLTTDSSSLILQNTAFIKIRGEIIISKELAYV